MLNLLIAPITSLFGSWMNNRAKASERKDRIAEAKTNGEIARIDKIAQGEIDYDVEAQRQMQHSFKDEFLMIVFSAPFVASFFPQTQEYVIVGWQYISQAPDWYTWAYLGIISATFGLRGWAAAKK